MLPLPPPGDRDAADRSDGAEASADAADVAAIWSVSAWEEALARHLAPAGTSVIAGEPFRATLRTRDLDVAQLLHLKASPHRLRARPSDTCPSYHFLLPVEGSVRAVQADRRAVVRPGRFVVLDTTTSYDLVFEEDAAVVIIGIPQRTVAIPPPLVRQLTATWIGVDSGLVSSIMALLVRLAGDLLTSSPRHTARLAYNLTDLLTTVLLEQLSIAVPGGRTQRLMLAITAYIDDHLGDEDLSAETVASAHYISPRYLRKLFEAEHMKVSDWIRSRRLEACRRELIDPLLAGQPISAVAGRWGFPDPAHFSRLFKANHGCSPREFRRAGLARDGDDIDD